MNQNENENDIIRKTHLRRYYRKNERNISEINECINKNRKVNQTSYEIREDLNNKGFGMYEEKQKITEDFTSNKTE